MSQLTQLDKLLKITEDQNHYLLKNVKNPEKLHQHLISLRDDVIGLSEVKDDIADQTLQLMKNLSEGKSCKHMLNTIIYGPPGTGKTTIGLLLAKIWQDLGYLKKSPLKPRTSLSTPTNNIKMLNVYSIAMLIVILLPLIEKIFSLSKTFGVILIVVGLFLAYYYYNKNSAEFNVLSQEDKANDIKDDKNDDIIKVVSREDFVAAYLGQTAIKTRDLLESSKGKVLFIDEAYSLINSRGDPYGNEALTTLNLYLSENPEDLVVIFAGYKDLMVNTIFKEQPGLRRRCMWCFNAPGYSSQDLVKIFKKQLKKQDYVIKDKIDKLFETNKDLFKNYAGDTERLVNYVMIENTRALLDQKNVDGKIITREQLKKAMVRLYENNVDETPDKKPTLQDLIAAY